MQTFITISFFLLLFSSLRSQQLEDTTFISNTTSYFQINQFDQNTRSFTSNRSAFEANIFNPVFQSQQRKFQFNAGLSQSFFRNPAQEGWVGNGAYSPITSIPSYPNFVPVQVSPSIGLQSNSGTFYSFSQGAFYGNGFNPIFKGVNIVKPIGARKP